MKDHIRKRIFYCLLIITFLAIAVYNFLTPMLTDDMSYAAIVSNAHSFGDLLGQEYHQYMTWTGRSVNHMILRCFLSADKWVFNIFNSLAFVLLTLFIYANIEHKKKYDVFTYTLITLFIWTTSVSFGQTILWETGACNYLWGSTIIMGFITCFRYFLKKEEQIKKPILVAILMLLLGVIAGWCNENTSGGGILLVLLFSYLFWKQKKKVYIWMYAGVLGQIVGFLFMILAPGTENRKQYMEEIHTGLYAIASRWLKCTITIRDNFWILLAIFVVVFVFVRLQKVQWRTNLNSSVFFFAFLATCYALVLTPEPVVRAYFGAGIFLTTAVVQGIVDVTEQDIYVRTIKMSAIILFALSMFFTYLESGANLARIYRECEERSTYITEQAAAGEKDITVPMLRPDFETIYSDAYNSDLEEDSGYWINVAFASYYGVNSISAVPREDWTEY